MRVALVHDYLIQYGGAERVLEALCEIFPQAPIYTLVYDEKATKGVFKNKQIYCSFLNKIPFAKKYHRIFLMLMPFAVENFNLSEYDLVISDSASYAKGVITKPNSVHICYCHTPTRYVWDDSQQYLKEFHFPSIAKLFVPIFLNYIRLWDREAAHRVDYFVANSAFVKKRIKKYYHRDADVIFPPVLTGIFNKKRNPQDYFLMVGRLLAYKQFEMAILAFNELGLKLKIIGDGPDSRHLKKISKSNIEFLGIVSDEILADYYAGARALIFPQEEDFGIAAVEAMASGTPIIAFRGGGALEIVKEGETGIFFSEQTEESLKKAVLNFNGYKFDSNKIKERAKIFDKEVFIDKIKKFICNVIKLD